MVGSKSMRCGAQIARFWLRRRRVSGAYARILKPVSTGSRMVADATTPLLKFKMKRQILILDSSRLGKNYLIISDVEVKLLA